MNLELEHPDSNIYIKHYQPGTLQLPEETITNNLIFTPNEILSRSFEFKHQEIDESSIDLLLKTPVDIILLGTGSQFIIPKQTIIQIFAQKGKSLEFMQSHAACRTFNVLALEKRKVACALII